MGYRELEPFGQSWPYSASTLHRYSFTGTKYQWDTGRTRALSVSYYNTRTLDDLSTNVIPISSLIHCWCSTGEMLTQRTALVSSIFVRHADPREMHQSGVGHGVKWTTIAKFVRHQECEKFAAIIEWSYDWLSEIINTQIRFFHFSICELIKGNFFQKHTHTFFWGLKKYGCESDYLKYIYKI